MSEGKIKYAYKDYGQFKTTFSCTHELVDEEFFKECMKMSQTPRDICPGIGAKALCEQCDFFGRKAEFFSEWDGKTIEFDNPLNKKLAE